MSTPAEIAQNLRDHLALCQEIHCVVERENQALRGGSTEDLEPLQTTKKNLLPQLKLLLDKLRQYRTAWQKTGNDSRRHPPEVTALLRQNQDVIMKIILLDRENEQCLLRRGMIPAKNLPSVRHQQPNYVAGLYQRQAAP